MGEINVEHILIILLAAFVFVAAIAGHYVFVARPARKRELTDRAERDRIAAEEKIRHVEQIALLEKMVGGISKKERLAPVVFEHLPDAIIVANAETGSIELVNDQTCRLFGYHESEMVGQSIEMLVPFNVRAKHVLLRKSYENEPTTRRVRSLSNLGISGQRKNGALVKIDICLRPLPPTPGESGTLTVASIRRTLTVDDDVSVLGAVLGGNHGT